MLSTVLGSPRDWPQWPAQGKRTLRVVGRADRHMAKSIYFFDPNGIRLELTCRTANETELEAAEAVAHAKLAQWRREHGFAG
jgi:hypothetical protein